MTTQKANNGKRDTIWKLLFWAMGIYCTVSFSISGYFFKSYLSLEIRITKIESNRFTSGDAATIYREIANIRTDLAKIPAEIPPRWLREKIEKLENRLDNLQRR